MKPISACRSCGNAGLQTVLELGVTPLANALLTQEQLATPEEKYPLTLVFCPDCSLTQIVETVAPEKLFGEYLYLSSFSETMIRHAGELAQEMMARLGLGTQSLVIEAASNDGYLLQHYARAGVPVLGIEPARNIAEMAQARGLPTLAEFFSESLGRQLRQRRQRADVFHAHNVLAHVADLNGFVAGIRHVLKDDGLAVIEAPYVRDMIEHCEFDTIYHEHLCYFSLTALVRLFDRHGLLIRDVLRVPIHGGTLRIYATPKRYDRRPAPSVTALLAEERHLGLGRFEYYRTFGNRVRALRASLKATLTSLKASGKRVAAYGASAKGSTLLNFCGVGREVLEFVADRSTVKQGRYTPGTRLPICPPEKVLEEMPDYLLLLTWNFADEIMRQQQEYRRRGGKFIVPVPQVRVA
jgi:SAM-dependent methyltransferase